MPSGVPRAFHFVRRFLTLLLFLAALGALGAGTAWFAIFRPHITPVERGRRIAEANGCFGCHGPEGTRGAANPGRIERSVPSFRTLMMYAKTKEEVIEWIRDGVTASRRKSETWRAQRDAGTLRMPAYRKRLSPKQLEDLAAFVMTVSGDPAPEDSLALLGRDRAAELGCVGCHGEGGRYARPNPGSLKGYVPPWDGPDFPELVRGPEEFAEWVERGVSRRFQADPLAMHFLQRAALRMPAYRRHLAPGDVGALWAYVLWLRTR